ncbi:hypothetical protein [Vallitalea okinawensis]|uniref:hypothetical protein n=1 Tax=Vallitalea okinawensis TaxID=2078660 RepID=UPI001FA8F59D|nr:hypothetical protein [Vallitalea okinawensis]
MALKKESGKGRYMKLSFEDYQEIRSWMYRNARQIDLTRWQYCFEKGSKEAVLSALSFYQNDDGGFGHGLEADSWNPNSSPYTTLRAITILKEIEFTDVHHPIIKGILKFLESGTFRSENGWYFNIPSNDGYAHAPWWTFNMEANAVEGIGVTAEIAAFVFRYADKDSELYKKALTYTDIIINKLGKSEEYGDMGIRGYCVLLDDIQQANLTWRFDCKFLKETLSKLIHDSIEVDTTKWVNYTVTPSQYITSPESIFYKGNEEIMSRELDYLIETRPQKGVWDITWSWFENNAKYAKEFAISQNWWKAYITIDKINLLRNFDRLDEQII